MLLLLLVIAPGSQYALGAERGVVGGDRAFGEGCPRIGSGEAVGEDARAVEPLPPEAIVGQPVVDAPARFGGDKEFQAGLFDQLRQAPGKAKGIWQPEDRRGGVS